MKIAIPSHLSDSVLVSEAKRLAQNERDVTAHLVAHLAEIDARRLYLGEGFPSLFAYCREVLGLSEQSTYNRIEAARAARTFPLILDMLSDADLTLATVRLVAPHLTLDNHEDLLNEATRKSKREVQELLARRFPQPAVADSVRKVAVRGRYGVRAGEGPDEVLRVADMPATLAASPGPPLMNSAEPTCPGASWTQVAATAGPAPGKSATPTPAASRGVVKPLAEDRYEIRFTARASTCEKLRLAQDLLRHAVPEGEMAEIIDRALTALLDEIARKRFAASQQPRDGASGGAESAPPSDSRYVSAEVRRTVWLRDGGRCAFIGSGGRRCGTRAFIEFHHVDPVAIGGQATPDNIQLRCRNHNVYEAQLYFDPAGLMVDQGEQLAPGQVEQRRFMRETEIPPH